ncbi:MAG: cell division protein ZapA [Xanthomonadales bacterium]|nr:cell division protein ZapA [Xanthomonadales bacterium]
MSEPVAVRILDREYLIACAPDERSGLIGAAAYLDGKLRELRNGSVNRGGGLDRIAVLAALNIAHELLALKQHAASTDGDLARELQSIKSKLDAGLPPSLQ